MDPIDPHLLHLTPLLEEDPILDPEGGVGHLDQQQNKDQYRREKKVKIQEVKVDLVDSLEMALHKIKEEETKTNINLVKRKNPKNFGRTDWRSNITKRKIYWDDRVPYIKVAPENCVYECHQGPDHDFNKKEKKRRRRGHVEVKTKKIGCPVRCCLQERVYFPQFDAKIIYPHAKLTNAVRMIRNDLKKAFVEDHQNVNGIRKIHLSWSGRHNHQRLQEVKLVENHVLDQISSLLWKGIDDLEQIRAQIAIKLYSKKEDKIIIPSIRNLQVHVQNLTNYKESVKTELQSLMDLKDSDEYIYFQAYSEISLSEDKTCPIVFLTNDKNQILAIGSKTDNEEVKIQNTFCDKFEVLTNDNLRSGNVISWPNQYLLNPKVLSENQSENGFVLVYQSQIQKQISSQISVDILCLDILFDLKKENLTGFVILAKTVSFVPICLIILQRNNRKVLLKLALKVIKRNFTTNCSFVIVNANKNYIFQSLEDVFGCKAVISDHYRIQAWKNWFKTNSKSILPNMEKVNCAKSEGEIQQAVNEVKKVLKPNELFYWEKYWLGNYKRWTNLFACVKAIDKNRIGFYEIRVRNGETVITKSIQPPINSSFSERVSIKSFMNQWKTLAQNIMNENVEESDQLRNRMKDSLSTLNQIVKVVSSQSNHQQRLMLADMMDNAVQNMMPLMTFHN